MTGIRITAEAVTDTGLSRSENQDCLLVRIGEGPWGDFGLFVVADGMGGAAGGQQAARMAVQACEDWWNQELSEAYLVRPESTLSLVCQSLGLRLERLNREVGALGKALQARTGTTLSALFVTAAGYGLLHVGDSRVYGVAGSLRQLTSDDTYVAEQLRRGSLSTAQARNHPMSHVLLRCIGAPGELRLQQSVGPAADSAFLLCSDGYYQTLSDEELRHSALRGGVGLAEAVGLIYERGAPDNLTAITVTLKRE